MGLAARKDNENSKLFSPEGREILTAALMEYFDEWYLDTASQLNLLGMNPNSRNVLSYYRKAERAIPNEPDKIARAGLLVAIHRRLQELYPENPNIRHTWLQRRNQSFENLKPIEIMCENGLFGIADVLRSLDIRMVY